MINDNGIVSIPNEVEIQEFEIAELFGVSYQVVRTNIKAILKSNICYGDYSHGGVVYGGTVYPECYALDMIIAIAFRVQSPSAKVFREYIYRKLTKSTSQPLFIQIDSSSNIFN